MKVEWASLPGGEEWLLMPMLAGHYRYGELKDGSLDLADIALVHDAMALRGENERRYQAAAARQRPE